MKIKLLLLLCTITVNILYAQTDSGSTRSIGQNKFLIMGNAEATYTATKGVSEFGEVNFKPIFLWKISDKFFAEAEIEIETGGGAADLGLEYANMCYMVNPYLI